MSATEAYYYDNQLRGYIVQVAAVFAGLQVSVGANEESEARLISVPVKNASVDRVVGSIIGDNTQNKPLRLPLIAINLTNLNVATERYKGVGVVKRSAYTPTGGLVPDDTRVVQVRQPIPYVANFDVTLWASNQDQHYQMIEQLLNLFNPDIQLQTSDDVMDPSRVTQMELRNINFDENMPPGVDRRVIQSTLSFDVPIYLSIPAIVHNKIVEDIFLRIGAVSSDVETNYDILADLDSQGIEYEQVFDSDDLDID